MHVFNEGFKEILVKTFFWRTHYTFGNILFKTFGQIFPTPKLFCSPTAMIQPHFLAKFFFWKKIG